VTAPPEITLNGQTPCPLDRQPARLGGVLCHDHSRSVAAALDPDNEGDRDTQAPASIPAYWSRLDATPGRGGDDSRRAPGFRSTPPCNLHVVAIRDPRSRPTPTGRDDAWGEPAAAETGLANLARGIWDDLDVHGPDLPNGDVTTGGVPGLSAWLHAHVLDLTAHPDAAAIHGYLTGLVDQLRIAAGDPRDKPVGWCIDLIHVPGKTERVECGAPLYLPPPRPGVEVPASEPVLSCRRCGRRYAGRDLVRLRLANEQEAS
jgi:hypothetical protein